MYSGTPLGMPEDHLVCRIFSEFLSPLKISIIIFVIVAITIKFEPMLQITYLEVLVDMNFLNIWVAYLL